MSNDPAKEALLLYFSQNGLLLCNENAELPYLDLVGGSWNAIVSLMESGDVFYSRFYKNRVTYLSRELYFALKPFRQRAERLSAQSQRLLAFLQAAGEASAEQMQNECMLEKKALTEALNDYPDANRATSDQQVTITQPGATIRGRGLEAQLDTQRVTLKSEVRARYASSIQ